jgi:hypothetical protein
VHQITISDAAGNIDWEYLLNESRRRFPAEPSGGATETIVTETVVELPDELPPRSQRRKSPTSEPSGARITKAQTIGEHVGELCEESDVDKTAIDES